MKRIVIVAVLSLSSVALADAKEEAQKKIDDAMAQSCGLAKKNIVDNKGVCSDELAKMEKVDCAVKESRKSVDFLKVNGECIKKMKENAKAGGAKKEETVAAAGGDAKKEEGAAGSEKKKGSHCKVMDEAGAMIAEHDSEGSGVKCQTEIREKVKAEKCEPGKKLAFQFVGQFMGKEMKPSSMKITCPKK